MVASYRPQSYSTGAVLLHWLIALCFFGMVAAGLFMTRLSGADLSLKFSLYQWHKSVGITVLLLTFVRIGWRFYSPAPTVRASGWQHRAAVTSHFLLYSLTLLVPLAGWAMVSASPLNIPTVLYGSLPWPHLPPFDSLADKQAAEAALKLLHKSLAFAALLLSILHAGAAIRHHLILKDETLVRMIPLLKSPVEHPPAKQSPGIKDYD